MKIKPKPTAILILPTLLLFLFYFHFLEKRYLIYTCRFEYCGGIADQVRGMISVFVLANKTKRIFGVEETSKCGLSMFLRPNKYNWKVSDSEVGHLHSVFFTTMEDKVRLRKKEVKRENDFIFDVKESVVYLQTNLMPDFKNYSTEFKNIFYELFLISEDMENELTSFRKRFVGKNKSVCAQVRTGKHPGFNDIDYNNLGNISAIWNFLSNYDRNGYVLYMASDSKEVKMSAKRRFPQRMIDSPGDPFFTPKDIDDGSCSGHKKVFFDLMFLSKCDILLLTSSGIGFIASLLRDRVEEQFCFQNDITGVYPCPQYNLRWMRTKSEDVYMPLRGI